LFLTGERTARRGGELVLLYVLVGYCGVPMVVVGLGAFFGFDVRGGELRLVEDADDFLRFTGIALAGMGVASVLGLYYRGTYLAGQAIAWAIYWFGATAVHLWSASESLNMGHGNIAMIVVAHGLVGLVLLVALAMSGVWRKPA
jgi:hypothetical protein